MIGILGLGYVGLRLLLRCAEIGLKVPGLDMELLQEKRATVHYTDPHVQTFPPMSEHHFELSSIEPASENIASYDLLLLATDHAKFDYAMFQQHAKLIVDTRGVYMNSFENVVKV